MRSQGFTVWFTGLPCSGKSTLAQALHTYFDDHHFPSEILDGDEIRKRLTKGLGFSKEERIENIKRISFVAKLITRVGGIAITATISPYEVMRLEARQEIKELVEVYVNCPLEVCIKRDIKGHYAKAQRGEILQFTGISDPYEPPTNPEIVVHTNEESEEESLDKIIQWLISHEYLPARLFQKSFSNRG